MAALSHYVQNYLVSGEAAPRRGNGGFGGIPSQAFALRGRRDLRGRVAPPGSGRALATALGRPELASDPRFATVSARIANRDLVLGHLNAIFADSLPPTGSADLEAEDVPVSPVNTMAGVFANPQVRHRRMRRTISTTDGRRPST